MPTKPDLFPPWLPAVDSGMCDSASTDLGTDGTHGISTQNGDMTYTPGAINTITITAPTNMRNNVFNGGTFYLRDLVCGGS